MDNRAKQQLIVWWTIWAAFQAGIFVIYFYLTNNRAAPSESAFNSSIWLAGFAPLIVSSLLRWLALPLMPNAQAALTVFLLGIALAESCCFLGLFIFPAHRFEMFLMSVFGILQFIPVFASRYFG
jgi:hypothetical protein